MNGLRIAIGFRMAYLWLMEGSPRQRAQRPKYINRGPTSAQREQAARTLAGIEYLYAHCPFLGPKPTGGQHASRVEPLTQEQFNVELAELRIKKDRAKSGLMVLSCDEFTPLD